MKGIIILRIMFVIFLFSVLVSMAHAQDSIGNKLVASKELAAADPSLVAHYTFDEGASDVVRDLSVHKNHGKNVGATYVKAAGGGYVMRFDTEQAHVDCGNDASLDLTSAVTMEVWLKALSLPTSDEPGIVGKHIGSYALALGHNTIWAYFTTASGQGRTDARFSMIQTDQWMHIAVTFDGTMARMYRDGQLVDRAKAVGPGIKSAPAGALGNFYLRLPLIYGKRVVPTPRCEMDDVRVYNRALSSDEIVSHYKLQAKQMGKDMTAFGHVRLLPHVYDMAQTLLVEANYWGLKPLAAGAKMHLTLRDLRQNKIVRNTAIAIPDKLVQPAHSHTTSVCAVSAVNVEDKIEWLLNTKDIAAGEYQVLAVVKDNRGRIVGEQTVVNITLAAKPTTGKAKVLNNLVIELLDVKQPGSATNFVNPRDGWVYIASTVNGDVHLSIDGSALETGEAMRKLTAGEHTITIQSDSGAKLSRLIVRAIPQMLFDSIGYRPSPWLKCYGPSNWDFFAKAGIMDVHNVLVERAALDENVEHSRRWRARGKHIIYAGFIDRYTPKHKQITADSLFNYLIKRPGFSRDDRDGMLMSEFDGMGYPNGFDSYPIFEEVSSRMAGHTDKPWNLYGKFMYLNSKTAALFSKLIENGGMFGEEIYMQEKPTELGAKQYLNAMVRQRILRYQAIKPGCNSGLTAVLAYMTIPTETVNVDPNANYKVFMDMQMNMLANDPVFSQLGGVMWYHSAYVTDENLQWSAKLLRHYCIEGRRDMLSKDPYQLKHITNADFRRGSDGWDLVPAEKGSLLSKLVRGFGRSQGRYPRSTMGDDALWTKRSAVAPNRFSQRITHLQPGRLYSVKLITADYHDLTKGANTKKRHVMNIALQGVDILPDRSIEELFTRGGGSYAKEDRASNRWLTYRQIFFRARSNEANLTIIDWANSTEPGGPIGQELVHNFVEVEPYLD